MTTTKKDASTIIEFKNERPSRQYVYGVNKEVNNKVSSLKASYHSYPRKLSSHCFYYHCYDYCCNICKNSAGDWPESTTTQKIRRKAQDYIEKQLQGVFN